MKKARKNWSIEVKWGKKKGAAPKVYIDGHLAKQGNPIKKGDAVTDLEPALLITTKGKAKKKGKNVNVCCYWVCIGGRYYYICVPC